MLMKNYTYLKDGFEGKLYDAQNGDDRLLIVIQGLKGLELPEKYAELFSAKGYSTLALQYYGAEGQPSDMRAIPLEQFQTAIDCLKAHDNGRFKRFGIYGNSKGAGREKDNPCKAMVSFHGADFPYVPAEHVFSDFLKRCFREHRIQTLYFFDEWDKKGTEENEIPVENIKGDILFLTSTHDESVPAKRDAELLTARLKRCGFAYHFRHVNSETGSHNLGYFPVNNKFLPREKHLPEECQQAREETLALILDTLSKWQV